MFSGSSNDNNLYFNLINSDSYLEIISQSVPFFCFFIDNENLMNHNYFLIEIRYIHNNNTNLFRRNKFVLFNLKINMYYNYQSKNHNYFIQNTKFIFNNCLSHSFNDDTFICVEIL